MPYDIQGMYLVILANVSTNQYLMSRSKIHTEYVQPRLGGLTVEETAVTGTWSGRSVRRRLVIRKADRACWKIEVCLVHVRTSYHKYRLCMYFVPTQYKPSI
jgi:hypothetical protein